MVKLIAIDLDDTLLNSNGEISEFNREIISNAYKNGIKIVLASGRPLVDVTINFYKYLDVFNKGEYFIGYNGGAIYDVGTKEELYSDILEFNEIMEIHSSIDKKYDGIINHFIHQNNCVLYDVFNEYVNLEYLHNNIELKTIDFNNVNEDLWTYKYMLSGDPEVMKEVFKSIPKNILDKYNVCVSMPCYIEFQHKSVSKGNAINFIAKRENIKFDEIIAIGDSGNDLSMIEIVKYGVCMANGLDKVKEKAYLVTDTNDLDGVGKAINKILDEERKQIA